MRMNGFLLICLLTYYSGFAQTVNFSKAVVEDGAWSKGTVTLNDGEILAGQLKLNTKTGLLAFEGGSTLSTFTPRNILAFEFFDTAQQKKRNFITVDFKGIVPANDELGSQKNSKALPEKSTPQFFEILVELKQFALLSLLGQMQVVARPVSSGQMMGVGGNFGTIIEYSQSETLFIFDSEGNVTPVLDITNKEFDRNYVDTKGSRNKKLGTDVLEELTASHFDELRNYIKEFKLSLKKREDVIQILEYYKGLETN